jgi:hypothetical protein
MPEYSIFVTAPIIVVKVVAPKAADHWISMVCSESKVFRCCSRPSHDPGPVGSDKVGVGAVEPNSSTAATSVAIALVTITSEKSQTDGKTTDHTASGFRKLVEEPTRYGSRGN